ncbi:hypothetical protein H6F61_19910 [Cyanobacteria bacterium FACHB-472]|nr:hypothetical protein [Cyanobacteria bacterium FACHB-472]
MSLTSLTSLEWFTNKQVDQLLATKGRVDTWLLRIFGWEKSWISEEVGIRARWDSDLPNTSGVYVFVNEFDGSFLYVGQAANIYKRVCNKNHHKLKWIINHFESNPLYCGNTSAIDDILVYHKKVNNRDFNNSLKRSLVWCESITIGILKPVFQDETSDIYNIIEGTGQLRITEQELEDDEDFED